MRAIASRPGLFGFLTLLLVAPGVFLAGVDTPSEGAVQAAVAVDARLVYVTHPPALVAAVAELAGTVGVHSVPLQDQLIEHQGFDDEEFPPDGWNTLDLLVEGDDPAQHAFSRETCDVDATVGGNVAAAWAVGGGELGDQLTCGAPYTEKVQTALVYGPIDARDFNGGVEVALRFKFDLPRSSAFLVCALIPGSQTSPCYSPQALQTGGWAAFRNPLAFPQVAGLERMLVAIIYEDNEEDTDPSGTNFGLFVDEVAITGLAELRPTETPFPTQVFTALPPVLAPAYLPHNLNKADKDMFPDPVTVPPGATVRIGTVVMGGLIANAGTAFQYGAMNICTQIQYYGQPAGQELSWLWVRDGAPVGQGNESLNPKITMETGSGVTQPHCLQYAPPDTGREPIPRGTWAVRASVGGTVIAEESAVISDSVPPGATAVPPTITAIPPSPTPDSPDPEPNVEQLVNGDFERGPSIGWRHATNATGPPEVLDINRVIRNNLPTQWGQWAAALGGYLAPPNGDFIDQIQQDASPTGLFAPSEIVSATLTFYFAMLSNETPGNGVHDDVLFVLFANQANQVESVAAWSEESGLSFNTWYLATVDVTAAMTRRDGWDNARLVLSSVQDDKDGTFHYLDEVSLKVRSPSTAGLRRAASPQTEAVSGSDLVAAPALDRRAPLDTSRVIELVPVPDRPLPALPRQTWRGVNTVTGSR